MRYSNLAVASLIASVGAAPSQPSLETLEERMIQERSLNLNFDPFAVGVDLLAVKGIFNLGLNVAFKGYPNKQKCTLANVAVRREWGTLTVAERREYTSAVNCLAKKTAKTNPTVAPGAKNRYDDFVAAHINQTMNIHGTGNFLAWHRYFTWAYEQALRNECGYTGYQPYWNWGKYAKDPINSPIFDGTDASMGGNGEYVPHNDTCIPSPDLCQIRLPAGRGGGCVKTGPFKDWSVNLGPVVPGFPDVPLNPSPWTGLGYNPRCLRRDISVEAAKGWTKDSDTVDLIKDSKDAATFFSRLQGDFPAGYLGVHTGGHFTIGGDPGGDLFTSPGDPAFFLHHANIDRVWWIWQNLDLEKRQYAIAGTITVNNQPPSRDTSLDDIMDLGVNAGPITIRDGMHTLGGPYCYIYT